MHLNEFQEMMNDTKYHDKVFLFLQNVFNLRPEDKFFHLIKESLKQGLKDDKDIYRYLQSNMNDKFYYAFTYALPALFKQKRVLCEQTIRLLNLSNIEDSVNGYLEIGTVGRYASRINKVIPLKNVTFFNDKMPSYSIIDIFDREAFFKFGRYEHMTNNQSIPKKFDNSLELLTCYAGLHHVELDELDDYIAAISRSLKPGGLFILRDHDCKDEKMKTFVSLIHTIFNAGTNVSLEENFKEISVVL